jgi:tRNA nucleotidyltransferase (CCA-adding enzyme)
MDVILTHEMADFDALGALLGASLVSNGTHAVAVLPRRANRNARAFLTLYGDHLPFTDQQDLPPGSINNVTLVDTQSLNTIKGMGKNTRVRVIDHHPRRSDLPEHWSVDIVKLGACTTHFVEQLREHDTVLNVPQATLLLLGIYEDTGSLTYVSTTPRDAHAAAYLLEQGASLRIAGEFLNPPLAPDQLTAYDRLLSSVETLTIQGLKILLAHANVEQMTEEISSVAHKLRDLLDPDGLFILVQTPEGVRLVARSTTDQINTASISGHFGGGGHDRAAGALIRPEFFPDRPADIPLLEYTYQKLREVVVQSIKPSLTVRQIMSRRPRTLAPDTSVREAAYLMQRYGYEGYPVVDNGRVIGLLTRRAVDRALAHKLELTAASLMDAGEIVIGPNASVQDLQRLMTDTGWGQIPVIDPDTLTLVGIVTRTDLLKVLAGGGREFTERKNLSSQLSSVLPTARVALLKAIGDEVHAQHQAAYIVGGFVRDILLGLPGFDFDVVIEGDAIAIARALAARYGGRVVSHTRFGTAKWQIKEIRPQIAEMLDRDTISAASCDPLDLPESLDLITARMEFYDYPTALPTVERSSIKLDLHRRDFTINTLALRLDGHHYGELYDYWGGLNDLRRKVIRVLHSLSFVDDPTRMLRAVRFEQRFRFQIDDRTLQLMAEARTILKQVSGQRLRHELDLILGEHRAAATLARLDELGLLRPLHPDLRWSPEYHDPLNNVIRDEIPAKWDLPYQYGHMPIRLVLAYLVWLIDLPEDSLDNLCFCLHCSSQLREALVAGSRTRKLINETGLQRLKPSQIARILDPVPLPALYALTQLDMPSGTRNLIEKYAVEWKRIQPVTDGNELQRMEIPRGPIYRTILEDLRSAWLDGQIHTPEQEKTYLAEKLRELAAGD